MRHIHQTADELVRHIEGYRHCVVAFSGGVDSTVVAKAAHLALGSGALAVTSVSASLPRRERQEARELARLIGIRHQEIHTEELSDPAYRANQADRCFHCKSELYRCLVELCRLFPETVIVNGTNVDDLQDYRPGLAAADAYRVRCPLVECHLGKQDVRAVARHFELPNWEKPATPCLSSRIAHGIPVTPERLRMIERAEQTLRERGFGQVRVRYHENDLARIEVRAEDIPRFVQAVEKSQLCDQLRAFGFRFITLDLQGYRLGSMNPVVSLDALRENATASATGGATQRD